MSRKFTFYAYETDISDMFSEVSRLEADVIGLRSDTPKPVILNEPEVGAGVTCAVVPRALVGGLSLHGPPERGEWFLNCISDPVIEWIVSRVQGNLLYSGRLYFVPQDVDKERMQFIDKPEHVRSLADGLFAWARGWARRAGGRSCGPEAARAVRDGRVQLAAPT